MRIVGAQRRISLAYKIPNTPLPQLYTLWPDRPNKVPNDVWDLLLAQKNVRLSDHSKTSCLQLYLDTDVIWEMSPAEAQGIITAGIMPPPRNPHAGQNRFVPNEPDVPRTEKQVALERDLLSADRWANEFQPVGDTTVKPPPAPVVG